MMLHHFIDFIVDYFTNLNAKKIFGGILVLIGLSLLGKIASSMDTDKGIIFAIAGIIIAGIGFVVIYYDMAKDKINGGHDELRTLTNAYKQKELEERKITSWHMNDNSDDKKPNHNQ